MRANFVIRMFESESEKKPKNSQVNAVIEGLKAIAEN